MESAELPEWTTGMLICAPEYLFYTLLGQRSHIKLLDREVCSLGTGKINSVRWGGKWLTSYCLGYCCSAKTLYLAFYKNNLVITTAIPILSIYLVS